MDISLKGGIKVDVTLKVDTGWTGCRSHAAGVVLVLKVEPTSGGDAVLMSCSISEDGPEIEAPQEHFASFAFAIRSNSRSSAINRSQSEAGPH